MNKTSFREELAQPTNVQGVLWCSIYPTLLRSRGCACGFEPSRFNLSFDCSGFAFCFQIFAVAQDEAINALTESSKHFVRLNFHCAQNRVVTARSADLICDRYVNRKI